MDGAVVFHPLVLSPSPNIATDPRWVLPLWGAWALPMPRVQVVCMVQGAHSATCAWHRVQHCRVLAVRVPGVRDVCAVQGPQGLGSVKGTWTRLPVPQGAHRTGFALGSLRGSGCHHLAGFLPQQGRRASSGARNHSIPL